MKRIITIIFMVISAMIYSQNPTVTIANLQVNNVNLAAGAPIDMGTNSSVNLKFRVDLAKGAAYDVGPATVYISVYKSNGSFRDYETAFVPTSQFSTGASKNFNFDLFAEDVDFGNGNYLVAILKQDNPPGVQWNSAHRSIIKTPAFSLTSSTNSIPCGSTSPVTFTVNGPSGTLSYNWNVGSGWSPSGSFPTSTNSIQLTPTSYPPTQVKVVPIFNGVSLPELSKNIILDTFNPTLTIAGNTSLCTTATYSVSNLTAGVTVTSWISSNTSVATISANGNQATLTAVGNGVVTVIATVTNACGQPKDLQLPGVFVGKPKVTDNTLYTNATSFKINTSDQFNITAVAGQNITYQWSIVKLNSTCVPNGQGQYPAGTFFPRFVVGSGFSNTLTSSSRYATINWGTCPGNYVVNVQVLNSCGVTDVGYKSIQVIDPYATDPCLNRQVKIYPNPVKNGSVVVRIPDPNGPPCGPTGGKQSAKTSVERLINDVQIYNMMGKMVYKNSFENHEFRMDNLKLNNGSYIIVIQDNLGNLDRQLLIIDN